MGHSPPRHPPRNPIPPSRRNPRKSTLPLNLLRSRGHQQRLRQHPRIPPLPPRRLQRSNPALPHRPPTIRIAVRDTTINNTPIPKGTRIFLTPWGVNRSPHLWGSTVTDSVPERWIDAETGKA